MGSLRKGTQRVLLLHEEEEGEEEPILKEQPQKYCTFPITYPQLWEMYKKAQAGFWTGNPYDPFVLTPFKIAPILCMMS